MGFVPPGAEWYVAEIIEEISVAHDDQNVVHKNLVLVRASSPEGAYVRALEIGRDGESTYQNPKGEAVTSRFRGLGYLDVLHDGLEDGAELLYQQRTSVSEKEIKGWIRSKEELPLFQDRVQAANPDYSSKDIVDEANTLIQQGSKT
jgi:hypothetical protein